MARIRPRQSFAGHTIAPTNRLNRVGPYTLVEPIGHGGTGIVYRAVRDGTGAEVALKTVRVPNVDVLGGVRREILALARLDHPGVVRILDRGLDEGLPWYAMTLLEGVSLRDRLRALGRARRISHTRATGSDEDAAPLLAEASPADVAGRDAGLRIMQRLCRTLAYLHGECVIHLDLKPEYVLVVGDDIPVVVDFGLAARLAEARRAPADVYVDEAVELVRRLGLRPPAPHAVRVARLQAGQCRSVPVSAGSGSDRVDRRPVGRGRTLRYHDLVRIGACGRGLPACGRPGRYRSRH